MRRLLGVVLLVVLMVSATEAVLRRDRIRLRSQHKAGLGPRIALQENFVAYCTAIVSVADVVTKMEDVITQNAVDDSLDDSAVKTTFCSSLTDANANDATHCTAIALSIIFDPDAVDLIKTIANPSPTVDDICETLKPSFDHTKEFWTTTDIRTRFGIESEIRFGYVFSLRSLPGNGVIQRTNMGVVKYSQPLLKTKGDLLGLPLFQVTVDAVNNKFKGTYLSADAKSEIARNNGVKVKDMQVDETGIRGMAEFVTAPMTTSSPENSGIAIYRGMQLLLNSMKKMTDTSTKCKTVSTDGSGTIVNAEYPYGGSSTKAINWLKVIEEYNTELAKLKFDDIDATNVYGYKDKLKLELAGPSNYYLRCDSSYDFYTQHTQINYAIPLTSWTKEKMLNVMVDPLARDMMERCQASADKYMTAKFSGIAKTDSKYPLIRNLFSLLTIVKVAETFNEASISNKVRSAHLYKDTFDQLPKVNIPDLVRLMPEGVRTALATWYSGVTNLKTEADKLIDDLSLPSIGYFSGLRSKIPEKTPTHQLKESRNALDTAARKKGSLSNLKTKVKSHLKDALPRVFAIHGSGTACHDRYPGDDPSLGKYSGTVAAENDGDDDCNECPRYLPAGSSDSSPYFVVEARIYQNTELNKLVEIKSTTYATTSLSGGGFTKFSVLQ